MGIRRKKNICLGIGINTVYRDRGTVGAKFLVAEVSEGPSVEGMRWALRMRQG